MRLMYACMRSLLCASLRRHPDEIAERAKASAEKLTVAKQDRAQQQRAEMQSRMDRYFQPFGYGL